MPVCVQSMRFGTEIRPALLKSLKTLHNVPIAHAHPSVEFFEDDRTQPYGATACYPPQTQGCVISHPQGHDINRCIEQHRVHLRLQRGSKGGQ